MTTESGSASKPDNTPFFPTLDRPDVAAYLALKKAEWMISGAKDGEILFTPPVAWIGPMPQALRRVVEAQKPRLLLLASGDWEKDILSCDRDRYLDWRALVDQAHAAYPDLSWRVAERLAYLALPATAAQEPG